MRFNICRAAIAALVLTPCGYGAAVLSAEPAGGAATAAAPDAAKPLAEFRADILAWRKTLDDVDESPEARQDAAAKLMGITDERAIPILMDLWKKEESPQKRKVLVSGLESIGTRKAFNELVKISCEDGNFEVRAQAAKWIAKQDNREDAIPQFVKYLKGKKYFRNALTSLGYTDIAKNAARPDPELVAALIDNLITVTPKHKWVPLYSDTGYVRLSRSATARQGRLKWVKVVEYEKTPNKEVKQMLYQYTSQDYEYDQAMWRKHVLIPLKMEKPKEQ